MDGGLREVAMPAGISGALYLSSMPGRFQPLPQTMGQIRTARLDRIICLTPEDEIRWKSPDYAEAIRHGDLPCPVQIFPIPDFGEPEDRHAFLALVWHVRDRLLEGERLLVHCAAGFGRTGTVATCVLVALGMEPDRARDAIRAAGARPEFALVGWLDGGG